ncbi:hypothetical protein [Spiroplasma endosymbiont of Aspidapion aeneum]|uniref:hypothetical protein n=1 Tax=Spiroplasma endosymbiont of Aspidapion aeneum TaxID=3066276 RepID=UPI00313DB952
MDIFKKKKKVDDTIHVSQQSEYEIRQPNYSTYDDDPLLNIEPVFENSPEAAKITEQLNIKPENTVQNYTPLIDNDKEELILKNKLDNSQNLSKNKNVGLANIINSAVSKANEIKNDVNEKDHVIAKLNKIEQMRSSGKVDQSLFTDVSKSKSSKDYLSRAREYSFQNLSKSNRSNENAIERALRLQRQAEKARLNEYTQSDEDNLINNTMIQRRIKNNKNAFAIQIDKNEFYIGRTERLESVERNANILANKLFPRNNTQIKNSMDDIPEIEVVKSQISEKLENESEFFESQLIEVLRVWQQTQINKINKMISSKINQIQNKTFKSEDEKVAYLKYKIEQLKNSIKSKESKKPVNEEK